LLLPAAATAAYKQWIPNTNFETASNWDEGRVPCASDVVHFEKNKVLNIFILFLFFHYLILFYLPLNGEFVLASGAGFAAFDGSWDPGCDSGATVRFADAEQHTWFDPTLWQALSPGRELDLSGRIFSVDEERVPCRYDDVIFQPETSFRVNVDSSRQVIHLRSISLMGQVTLSSNSVDKKTSEARRYFLGQSSSGRAVEPPVHTSCMEVPKGPQCLLQQSELRSLPGLSDNVLPVCFHAAGATINLDFTPDFDLQKYQDRLVQALLSQPKYTGVRMAISKVHKAQTFLGVIPQSSTPLIQIVLIDDEAGAQTGTIAEQLAADIMDDIAQHGEALGISSGKMEVATGSTFSGQVGSHALSRITAGTVLGLLFSLLLLGGILFLHRKGKLR
ncbi:AMNLS protein, partial [Phaetusa simplex]|nr:AMNLS protein [Phaetusa simplex]